ncbi:MAG: Phthalate 4,5-dioxygenase [Betaproteobacteria bacterium]|nr:Phthalate 4,5-dioxygenase [Betaproteobacteria bacterium]
MEKLLNVVVASKVQEGIDIVAIELASQSGGDLPEFTAGAHVDVHVPGGLVRQYSLCNDPRERHRYLIAVLREASSRGGSVAMHDSVQEGDVLSISLPRNHFPLIESACHSLLLAGGIGVTPLLAMAERLTQLGASFDFHYCARSIKRMAFRQHVLSSRFADRVQFHFDDADDAQRLRLDLLLPNPARDTQLYVCGPAGYIDHVLLNAAAQGWRESQLHREYFVLDSAPAVGGDEFQIKVASTGQVITVPEDRNVVDVLKDIGIEIAVSCEQGVCGTCLTGVLDGVLDHRDFFMTDSEHAEGRQFSPCCSRGKGLVLLDL